MTARITTIGGLTVSVIGSNSAISAASGFVKIMISFERGFIVVSVLSCCFLLCVLLRLNTFIDPRNEFVLTVVNEMRRESWKEMRTKESHFFRLCDWSSLLNYPLGVHASTIIFHG